MTNEEIRTAFDNQSAQMVVLMDKLNRIEAMQAVQTSPRGEKITIDIDTTAVAKSIAVIESALRDIEARRLVTINGTLTDAR